MRYSASNPLHRKFHFSALRHGDDGVVGRLVCFFSDDDVGILHTVKRNILDTTVPSTIVQVFFLGYFPPLPGYFPLSLGNIFFFPAI
jgi:hypothetical protein